MMLLQMFFWLFITLLLYVVFRRLYQLLPYPFMIPVLTCTVVLVVVLTSFDVSYDTYFSGGQWIDALLGPAIVALAFPLYKQRKLLNKFKVEIFATVLTASLLGILSGYWLAVVSGYNEMIVSTIISKNVTTPVAMEVASMTGGEPAFAVIFVMIAGIGGAVTGPWLFQLLGISNFLGIGMAFGGASHAIGTAKALEYGEREAAISSIGLSLCALCVSLLGPLLLKWIS
ncbi:LrgB family protein [Bacillus hwajinpoensis]|uniref:LrgB family protein n=1 Tax=Guptibacillus hwajinpoensis TaxID=208199 RepID=A0A845ES69_9BACL|nr:LrgB family protein [Pseudalkalibacillus hwajinpoensis]MYL62712.1 LrgB family protein [Pseudalkalibacillus hwajinpoensis]